MSKQVFPQAPSPTMTSLRRNSAMVADGVVVGEVGGGGWFGVGWRRGVCGGVRLLLGGDGTLKGNELANHWRSKSRPDRA